MSAQTFAAIEAGGYALAAILLMATAIYFFTRHVLAVRDELTGRAARRAIEELRSGGISRPVADMARGGGRGPSDGASESGSLHVRWAHVLAQSDDRAEKDGRHGGLPDNGVAYPDRVNARDRCCPLRGGHHPAFRRRALRGGHHPALVS